MSTLATHSMGARLRWSVAVATLVSLTACDAVVDTFRFRYRCRSNAECVDGQQCVQGICRLRADGGSADGGAVDGGPRDAGQADAGGAVDGGTLDAGTDDAGGFDAGVAPADAGALDAGGTLDAGTPDAGSALDSGQADSGVVVDAGSFDGGVADAGGGVVDAGPFDAGLPLPQWDGGWLVIDGGAGCSASGWCWFSPRPLGFQECVPSASSSRGGFVLLDRVPYLVVDGGLQRLDAGLPASVTFHQVVALSPSTAVLSASTGALYELTVGQPLVQKGAFSVPPTVAISGTGDWWASVDDTMYRLTADAGWVALSAPPGITVSYVLGFAPTGPDQAYICVVDDDWSSQYLFHYDGGWSYLTDAGIDSLWGDAPGRVYATLGDSRIARLTPTGMITDIPAPPTYVFITGEASGDLFGSGGQAIWSYSGGQWSELFVPMQSGVSYPYASMTGHDGLACMANGLSQSSGTDGGSWTSLLSTPAPINAVDQVRGIAVREDGAAYVAANGITLLDDRANAVLAATYAGGITQLGFSDYLVHQYSSGFRRLTNGTLSAQMPSTFQPWDFFAFEIAAESPNSAWAVGRNGLGTDGGIVYWNGATWSHVVMPQQAPLARSITSAGGSTWVSIGARVYARADGGWVDLGSPNGDYVDNVRALSSSSVLACSWAGISRWPVDGGWLKESNRSCASVATDPISGSAVAVSYSAPMVSWRVDGGTWVSQSLPGDLGSAYSVRLGIRGTRAWAIGEHGTVLVHP